MIRVFVADDRDLVREGIVAVLGARRDIEVIGEAASAAQLRRRLLATRPEILVVGRSLAFAFAAHMRQTDIAVLGTRHDGTRISIRIPLQVGAVELARIVSTIQATDLASLREPPADLVVRMRRDPRENLLNHREEDVLSLLADGLPNRAIGEVLGLSEKTVKNYVSSLFVKLGVSSRTQAVVLALSWSRPHHAAPVVAIRTINDAARRPLRRSSSTLGSSVNA